MNKLSPVDEEKLHDWITDGMDINSEEEAKKTGMVNSDIETELLKFQTIRKALGSLPMLEPPKSFRLTSDMVGVKPPRPRFSLWMNGATAFFSLLFLFSLGLRINGMFFSPVADSEAAKVVSEESFESAEPASAMAPAGAAEPVDLTLLPDTLALGGGSVEEATEPEAEIMEEPPADIAMKAAPQEETMSAEDSLPAEPVSLNPGIQALDWLVWVSFLLVFLLLAFTGKMRERYE